jgi:phage terminase large subunit
MPEIAIEFAPHKHQRELIDYFRKGGRKAVACWHRRAGKDRVATFIESMLAFQRVGLYWHALPEYAQARKAVWEAITRDGQRLIDTAFPPQVVARRNEQEMRLELVNGSVWQVVGMDRIDSLVGTNPVHVTDSEAAIRREHAWDYIRPILAENNGTECHISTPRGYNHFHRLCDYAARTEGWFYSHRTVEDTGLISPQALADERAQMPDELFRQEFYCDFSAANVGAVLGRYLEAAEREGRITAVLPTDAPVYWSCDLGYRDTTAFWCWQVVPGGFHLIDHVEASGLDAEEWIDRIRAMPYVVGKIWLPHDARAKTIATRHSVAEQFARAFGANLVGVIPQSKIPDRINAARVVMPRCWFDAGRCAKGLEALRAWSYDVDERTGVYSRIPRHDWASHSGDGFSYGAQVLRQMVVTTPRPRPVARGPETIGEWIERTTDDGPRWDI